MKLFKINYSFLLLFLLIIFSPKQSMVFKLLLCLIIHELGHIIPIFISKYKVKKIELSVLGFFMDLEKNKYSIIKDIFIYLGGILLNIFCIFISKDIEIKQISTVLVIVNILPIYPLDGYNVLNSILLFYLPYYFSLIISKLLSILVLSIISLYLINIQIDLYISLNLLYLYVINFYTLYNIENINRNFLLEKYLYNFKYKIKNISFKTKIQHHFYKYNTINMIISNKCISEEELLAIFFEKT